MAGRAAGKFSLGMAQRLGIAAALLGDPATVVLDEPVNGLDVEGIRSIRALLRNLAAQGKTVFVSSHLMSEIAQTATHLIVIGRGRLIADTGVAEFTAHPAAALWALLSAVILLAGFGILYSLLREARPPHGAAVISSFDPVSVSLAGVQLAQIAVGVLGVLLITSEYATGLIRTTLAAVSRRLPPCGARRPC